MKLQIMTAALTAAALAATGLGAGAQAQSGHWLVSGEPEVRGTGSRACTLLWRGRDEARLTFTRATDPDNPAGARQHQLMITGPAVARVSDQTEILIMAPSGDQFTVRLRKSANPAQAQNAIIFLNEGGFNTLLAGFREGGWATVRSMTYSSVMLVNLQQVAGINDTLWNRLNGCYQQL